MLKKLIRSVLPKKRTEQPSCRRHAIRLPVRNAAAVRVLETLLHAGYESYLVGGAVRDLLLGREPKDFDIATAATPEQVTKLFRRSRIIGRRFQIVHVVIGRDTIEVSTFRSGGHVRQNENGRIMQDNAYGTVEQDAQRRDFTCNALYYDLARHEILDFCGGVDDVRNKRLRMIGNPAERYQEDPVRILRAVRLSGKLGFEADEASARPISECAHLLRQEPVARLFDELLKILLSGHAEGCLKQLRALGIDEAVHPLLTAMCRAAQTQTPGIGIIALRQTDQRLREDKSVSVGFMLAALFWDELNGRWQQAQQSGESPAAAMIQSVNTLRDDMERGWGVPQRYSATMREIWLMQPQFAHRRGGRPFRLLHQPRFRAAYDFLLLRAQTDATIQECAAWWTKFQHAGDAERKAMTSDTPTADAPAKKKRRRPRRRKKTAGNADAE